MQHEANLKRRKVRLDGDLLFYTVIKLGMDFQLDCGEI